MLYPLSYEGLSVATSSSESHRIDGTWSRCLKSFSRQSRRKRLLPANSHSTSALIVSGPALSLTR